ncbi:hypothetical protein RD792_013689 [Penstemon davidsonii]|uniref:Uncharacterized protein n=1 Tax=Penstemon davidsonii TaxID=160366 RepID=A0ABR0CVQ2_9LAMI|nr:hypothetical protein RD792_013689 [Penstemon davidsonii]
MGRFPGPVLNITTNYNVVVNVKNRLDEDLLMTWSGIQMRRASWQDGVLGTNCPIPPRWNWTYNFQVKDQIGSFFYYPSLNMQRASGGFGPIVVMNRDIISTPFATPDGDIVIMIGDWYTHNHTALRRSLEGGRGLGMPDGVLINGKGPYRYNTTLVPDGINHETINVDPECKQVIITLFASARFVNESLWQRVTGVAVCALFQLKRKSFWSTSLPDPPNDAFDISYSLNQAMSIRQNVTASGARPNPTGFFPLWGFIEIIVQNNDTVMQTFHMDGYSFFVVGMGHGDWTENKQRFHTTGGMQYLDLQFKASESFSIHSAIQFLCFAGGIFELYAKFPFWLLKKLQKGWTGKYFLVAGVCCGWLAG